LIYIAVVKQTYSLELNDIRAGVKVKIHTKFQLKPEGFKQWDIRGMAAGSESDKKGKGR
jgi:hypothetical protein